MPVFLSVSLFKACSKSFCYYLPVFRMGTVGFIFCEVVLFQKVDGFLKNTWYRFFAWEVQCLVLATLFQVLRTTCATCKEQYL